MRSTLYTNGKYFWCWNNNFEPLVNKVIESTQSWFTNGCSGSGKTCLVKLIQNYLKDNNFLQRLHQRFLVSMEVNAQTTSTLTFSFEDCTVFTHLILWELRRLNTAEGSTTMVTTVYVCYVRSRMRDFRQSQQACIIQKLKWYLMRR
jgi:hypothetical protein